MTQLLCENLTLGYDGKEVLSGISFGVNEGDYLCIIGENGSGKTTLLKALIGLHPIMDGKIITGDGINGTDIGYLPQQSEIQRDFPASVEEIVLSGCQSKCGLRPFYKKSEKALAYSAMEKMNILPLKKQSYRELSGGQQQRVLLARALCATGKLILLDEPVSGLDPKAAAEMYGIIDRLNKEDKISVIMISHDVVEVQKYASHILYIGKEIFFGTKDEYLTLKGSV